MLAWINCLEAMKELGQEIPINLKVSCEKLPLEARNAHKK